MIEIIYKRAFESMASSACFGRYGYLFTAFTSVWIIGANNVYVNENAERAPQWSNSTEHFALQPPLGFEKTFSIIKDIEVI